MKTGFSLSWRYNFNAYAYDDLHPLTMDQMIRPFYFCIGFVILAINVFIGEIIVFNWKSRRDRKYWILKTLLFLNRNFIISR